MCKTITKKRHSNHGHDVDYGSRCRTKKAYTDNNGHRAGTPSGTASPWPVVPRRRSSMARSSRPIHGHGQWRSSPQILGGAKLRFTLNREYGRLILSNKSTNGLEEAIKGVFFIFAFFKKKITEIYFWF